MAIADRKARERARRELLIVETADQLLAERGFHGLNLDELAERVEYSKATIYNHFESKEDLVAAVDLRHLTLRADLFHRALTFPGRTRERMFVVGWADRIIARMFPHWSSVHQLITSCSFFEKVAPERRELALKVGARCFSVAYEILQQARAQGDLPDDAPDNGQIMSGLISLAKGAHLLDENANVLPPEAGIQPLEMLNRNYHIYLDGVGWRPLSREFDYGKTEDRIRGDVFADELAAAGPG